MSSARRGLTHSELFGRSNRRIVQENVDDQVKCIDAAINTAHTAGFDSIVYDLPVTFNINNLTKADAQLLVYTELLGLYKRAEDDGGKGFTDVTIEIGPKPVLKIKWLNGMDEAERVQRRRFLLSCATGTKK